MEVEDSTVGEQLGLLPSVWWQLSPLWRLCALSLANCRDSAEEPPGLVEVAAEVWQKAFDACKEANRLAPPLSGSKRGALHVFLTTITAPVVRLDLRAEVRLTPDDLLAVAAAPALLAAQEVHLDLSELPQLSDHCLSRILTSLAANLVSLKLNASAPKPLWISGRGIAPLGMCTRLAELSMRGTQPPSLRQAFHSVLESGGCQALRVLDLSSSTWIKNTTLQQIGKHLCDLRSLDLSQATTFNDLGAIAVARGCPHLEMLGVGGGHMFSDNSITDGTLVALARHCPRLRVVNMLHCVGITKKGILTLYQAAKDLEEFDFSDSLSADDRNDPWLEIEALHPSVTSYRWSGSWDRPDPESLVTAVAKTCGSRLRAFEMEYIELPSAATVEVLSSCLTALEVLKAEEVELRTGTTHLLPTLVRNSCATLRVLHLDSVTWLMGDGMRDLGTLCPVLEELKLRFSTRDMEAAAEADAEARGNGRVRLDLRSGLLLNFSLALPRSRRQRSRLQLDVRLWCPQLTRLEIHRAATPAQTLRLLKGASNVACVKLADVTPEVLEALADAQRFPNLAALSYTTFDAYADEDNDDEDEANKPSDLEVQCLDAFLRRRPNVRVKGYAVDFEQVPPTYKFPEAPHYWAQIRSACLEFPDLDAPGQAPTCWDSLADRCSDLRHMRLSEVPQCTPDALVNQFVNLQSLDVSNLRSHSIAWTLPRLVELNVLGMYKVEELRLDCPMLRTLDLGGAELITASLMHWLARHQDTMPYLENCAISATTSSIDIDEHSPAGELKETIRAIPASLVEFSVYNSLSLVAIDLTASSAAEVPMALEELRANHLPHLRTLAVTCCPRLRYLQAAGLYRLERLELDAPELCELELELPLSSALSATPNVGDGDGDGGGGDRDQGVRLVVHSLMPALQEVTIIIEEAEDRPPGSCSWPSQLVQDLLPHCPGLRSLKLQGMPLLSGQLLADDGSSSTLQLAAWAATLQTLAPRLECLSIDVDGGPAAHQVTAALTPLLAAVERVECAPSEQNGRRGTRASCIFWLRQPE